MYLNRKLGTLASVWGITGAVGLLLYAITKMVRHMLDAFAMELNIWHYAAMLGFAVFMAYTEGYKGFQKSFSPRVASRAVYLRQHSTWLRLLLAPLFSIGYFHTTRAKQITVIVISIVITLIVILFRQIPQPWRGVLDVGVIVGLSWGIIATLIYYAKFVTAKVVAYDPMVVEPTGNQD